MYWNDLNSRLKAEYGCKVYKLALSSGCSCPNRDGTLDTRGCIFCDGAGAFAEAGAIPDQLAAARLRVAAKAGTDAKYIAYFQSFTNTYGDADRLRALYQAAMAPEDVVILSIATRPDCLGPDILGLLEDLNRVKPVWVELGLQTIHPESARYLRRGYDLPVFDRAVKDLKAIGVTVIVHQILGPSRRNTGNDGGDRPLYRSKRGGGRKTPSAPRPPEHGSGGGVAGRPGADAGIGGIYFHSGAVSAESSTGGSHPPPHRGRREAGPAGSLVERR